MVIYAYSHQENVHGGKTTILNEIGFTYQALGYDVFLVTSSFQGVHHFCHTTFNGEEDRRKIDPRKKAIAIIDEFNTEDDRFHEIIECLEAYGVPYVGFVKFKDDAEEYPEGVF